MEMHDIPQQAGEMIFDRVREVLPFRPIGIVIVALGREGEGAVTAWAERSRGSPPPEVMMGMLFEGSYMLLGPVIKRIQDPPTSPG